MSTTKHTAEPWVAWNKDGLAIVQPGNACPIATILPQSVPQDCEAYKLSAANAARIVQCINACAKFPDPAAALTDLRLLIGQARGLLAEGDTDRADKLLIAALGVLDGEEG